MAVVFKFVPTKNPDLVQIQDNIADVVGQLQATTSSVGVLKVTGNQKLVGNEDVVLVDASAASADVSIILPSPKLLQRAVTIKVTRASNAYAVVIKAVDIASLTSPSIDGSPSVSIPAKTTGSVRVVSDGKNFFSI